MTEPNHEVEEMVKQISMEMVLGQYGVDWLEKRGDRLNGGCPIHPEEASDDHYFMANLTTNLFECPDLSGNVIDLVAGMEECSIGEAMFWLKGAFGLRLKERRS